MKWKLWGFLNSKMPPPILETITAAPFDSQPNNLFLAGLRGSEYRGFSCYLRCWLMCLFFPNTIFLKIRVVMKDREHMHSWILEIGRKSKSGPSLLLNAACPKNSLWNGTKNVHQPSLPTCIHLMIYIISVHCTHIISRVTGYFYVKNY